MGHAERFQVRMSDRISALYADNRIFAQIALTLFPNANKFTPDVGPAVILKTDDTEFSLLHLGKIFVCRFGDSGLLFPGRALLDRKGQPMNTNLPRTITPAEIETYDQDGVVLLKGLFDTDWIELLDQGLAANRENPTPRAHTWDRDDAGRATFYDSQAWQQIDQYRQFVFTSPCAEIAGQLMQSDHINFFFDAIFVRTPGTQFATPWHQDEPYWTVDGYDTCSIWMPLVPVAKESALAFVPGSHRTGKTYIQRNFGELNHDDDGAAHEVDFSGVDGEPFPDIDSDPAGFGVISWDMEPGDCVAFNGRMIHGGSGNLDGDRDLRVFNTKWLGDDVRVKFRDHGMDPDHSAIMAEHGLKPGDRPGTDLYPEVWARG
jgi:ectoine hydroxylase-related dioxygenase (phytanoyl-CoA dioxygenase family)